jgi:hypothetical protein
MDLYNIKMMKSLIARKQQKNINYIKLFVVKCLRNVLKITDKIYY